MKLATVTNNIVGPAANALWSSKADMLDDFIRLDLKILRYSILFLCRDNCKGYQLASGSDRAKICNGRGNRAVIDYVDTEINLFIHNHVTKVWFISYRQLAKLRGRRYSKPGSLLKHTKR